VGLPEESPAVPDVSALILTAPFSKFNPQF
jgi:hypothetical protein